MIRDLLLEDPDDEALRPFLETGPFPAVERGYRLPMAGHGDH